MNIGNQLRPFCGDETKVVSSSVVYGREYPRRIRICKSYPKCDSYTGVGGVLADKETRELRMKCHSLFDVRWKTGRVTRPQAYRELQILMGLRKRDAHISRFNKEQCLKLLSKIT